MVKYFCDKCGRDIPEDNRYRLDGMKAIVSFVNEPDVAFELHKTLCEDCYDEVLALIGGDESE